MQVSFNRILMFDLPIGCGIANGHKEMHFYPRVTEQAKKKKTTQRNKMQIAFMRLSLNRFIARIFNDVKCQISGHKSK